MTDDRQSSDAEREADPDHTGGAIGTVVGATLGPFGAALGTVVDDTKFAVKLSVGGVRSANGSGTDGAAGRAGDADAEPLDADATTIEIEDATATGDDRSTDADPTEADDGDTAREADDDSTE